MPVETAPLFGPLARELVALLRRLGPREWLLPTSAGAWTVRDVAAHLLDGDLRRISAERDGHAAPPPAGGIPDDVALVQFLDTLNAEWVAVSGRLSTGLITDLLEWSGPIIARLMLESDPHGPALFPVAWAVRADSPRWLDTGREYTERWHHQDQIREAVGAPPLDDPAWLRPAIDVSLFAVPPAYAHLNAPAGTTVVLEAEGPGGAAWSIASDGEGWQVAAGDTRDADCRIRTSALLLARLLLHRLPENAIHAGFEVTGDAALAEPLLAARAVMVRPPVRPATT
jgi:hypothetical protein